MSIEIERKFVVKSSEWRKKAISSRHLSQGYLTSSPSPSVRIRISEDEAILSVKVGDTPLARIELEYQIPLADGIMLIREACGSALISKTRFIVPAEDGLLWEIDEFGGNLIGLTLAEIELPSAFHKLALPEWIGTEVTNDPRFLNDNLSKLTDRELRDALNSVA